MLKGVKMTPIQVLSAAWDELTVQYRRDCLPGRKEGFPARFWWSERDIVCRLASLCAQRIGWEWVHMEVSGFQGNRAVDLCLTNPEPWRLLTANDPWPTFTQHPVDLAIELKIVTVERGVRQYTPDAVNDDIDKLLKLQGAGLVRAAAVCVIDSRTNPTRSIPKPIGDVTLFLASGYQKTD
jgi:hypothetical protein